MTATEATPELDIETRADRAFLYRPVQARQQVLACLPVVGPWILAKGQNGAGLGRQRSLRR